MPVAAEAMRIADRAVKTRDEQIRDMFAELGVQLNFDAPPAAGKGDAK